MVALGESITVVNKSGKIVSTSKHLVNVFKEARSAYLERKAELKAERDGDLQRRATTTKAIESGRRSPGSSRPSSSRRLSTTSRDSSHSRHGSSASGSRHRDTRHGDFRDSRNRDSRHRDSRHCESTHHESSRRDEKSPIPRVYSDSFYTNGPRAPTAPRRTSTQPLSPSHLRQAYSTDYATSSPGHAQMQLARRHSDSETRSLQEQSTRRSSGASSANVDEVDMDLAYGEMPPALPMRPARGDEEELRTKMTALQQLLEEANCVQHSVRAVVKNLEQNPDALAAVALTLAEISNIVAKMAPGALTTMKTSFPVVVALLASPEFLIGGGVAIGVTIVMFGGYKIIKRIRAKKDLEKEGSGGEDELEEITSEVGKIDSWRRGIRAEDMETMSVATSVEGEFITPKASMQLREQGVIAEKEGKPSSSSKKDKSEKAAEKKRDKEMIDKKKKSKVEADKKEKKERKEREKEEGKDKEKEKEPSALKLLFKKDKEQVVA